MGKIKRIIVSTLVMAGLVAVPLAPSLVSAAPADEIGSGVTAVGGEEGGGQEGFNEGIKTIVNMMLFLLGVIAVIMIIIGGFRYATSNGDPGTTKAAKDTILYAVIGLVVAILAYAIVNFVVNAFTSGS